MADVARPKVKLNSRDMERLLKSDQVRPPLRDKAEDWAARARGSAPVDTGAYRSSIRVASATTDRAVERVVASVPYAAAVEARTGNLKRAMGG